LLQKPDLKPFIHGCMAKEKIFKDLEKKIKKIFFNTNHELFLFGK